MSGVDVEQDTLGDAEVASCIKALVARWRFPAPSGGSVDVSFPFVFQSSQYARAFCNAQRPRQAGLATSRKRSRCQRLTQAVDSSTYRAYNSPRGS